MSTFKGRQTHCHSLNSKRFPVAITKGSRSGLTLVEIMIALTMTLVVLGAMAQAFSFVSREISNGRAILEMSNRLRNVQQLIRTDLAGVTVDIRPHTENTPQGYFEYIDGPSMDSSTAGTSDAYLGDVDDVLAFTARNLEGEFRGRLNLLDPANPDTPANDARDIIQSSFAEIIWYTEPTDLNFDSDIINDNDPSINDASENVNFSDTITLYRRVLLIRPNLNNSLTAPSGVPYLPYFTGEETSSDRERVLNRVVRFFINNDISARWIDSNGDGSRDQIVANSLEDLARRENRFCRNSRFFPHTLDRVGLDRINLNRIQIGVSETKAGVAQLVDPVSRLRDDADGALAFDFNGDDILLTDVAAFDVKAYSPTALVDQIDIDGVAGAETFVSASDVGYGGSAESTASGDFIDLGALVKLDFPHYSDYELDNTDGLNRITFADIDFIFDTLNGGGVYEFDQTIDATHFWRLPTEPSGLAYENEGFPAELDASGNPTDWLGGGMDIAYCTWSPHYETDGIDQDGSGLEDQGTDGLDNDGINGVDDDGEQETAPPYPYPIRGLEIKFRIIEKNSKQIRQSTVVQNFLFQ